MVVRFRGRPWCGTVAGREPSRQPRVRVTGRQVPAVGAADGEARAVLDPLLPAADKRAEQRHYQQQHGVGERTIRGYLHRYRKRGPRSLLFYRPRPTSARVHDAALRAKLLQLIDELPTRSVPQLRKLIAADAKLGAKFGDVELAAEGMYLDAVERRNGIYSAQARAAPLGDRCRRGAVGGRNRTSGIKRMPEVSEYHHRAWPPSGDDGRNTAGVA